MSDYAHPDDVGLFGKGGQALTATTAPVLARRTSTERSFMVTLTLNTLLESRYVGFQISIRQNEGGKRAGQTSHTYASRPRARSSERRPALRYHHCGPETDFLHASSGHGWALFTRPVWGSPGVFVYSFRCRRKFPGPVERLVPARHAWWLWRSMSKQTTPDVYHVCGRHAP